MNAIVCAKNADRYEIVVPASGAGCTVHAHIHFVNLDGDLNMLLFNEANDNDANPVATSASTKDDDEIINFAAGTGGGTFQIKVAGVDDTVENTYDLTTNVTCP